MPSRDYRGLFADLARAATLIEDTFYRAIPPDSHGSVFEPGYSFHAGNRYNPPGFLSALYFADDEGRSRKESGLQYAADVFTISVRLTRVVKLDLPTLDGLGIDRALLVQPRTDVTAFRECQEIGLAAMRDGAAGLLVPSALPEASEQNFNLVVYPAALATLVGLTVIRRVCGP
jgi:RES domain-containing protein